MFLTTVGFVIVSVLSLGCDDSVIVEALREVLSMLDEVCFVGHFTCFIFYYSYNVYLRIVMVPVVLIASCVIIMYC